MGDDAFQFPEGGLTSCLTHSIWSQSYFRSPTRTSDEFFARESSESTNTISCSTRLGVIDSDTLIRSTPRESRYWVVPIREIAIASRGETVTQLIIKLWRMIGNEGKGQRL